MKHRKAENKNIHLNQIKTFLLNLSTDSFDHFIKFEENIN